jgi:hypothetical protein
MLSKSPPGSITAALLDLVHHKMEQFCCNGVTGTTMPRKPVSECCSSIMTRSAIAQEVMEAQVLDMK